MLQRWISYISHFLTVRLKRLKWLLLCALVIALMLKYETYDHELRESKKHKHIFFLKTHRTGSSTLQNILFRYGYRRNLTFALPAGQSCRFGYPMPLSLDHIQNLNHSSSSSSSNPDFQNKNPSSSINIFAHQARLNTNIFNDPKLLPSIFSNNKPYKITILRNPTTLLPSVFQYYNLEPVRLVQYNLTKFLGDTSKYYGVSDAEKNKLDFGLTRNGQTFDLGFAGIFHFSPPGIRQVIQETDDFFDLVMINEYFDESLILLKNELNWDFEDLLYASLQSGHLRQPQVRMSDSTLNKIREWAKVDMALYDYFNKTLHKKIENFGVQKMNAELVVFRDMLDSFRFNCFDGETADPDYLKKRGIVSPHDGYDLYTWKLRDETDEFCRLFVTPEDEFTRLFYRKQMPEYAESACGGDAVVQ